MTRSEVHCTNCGGQFIAEMDLSLNGNHEITCPLCQHVHYRVVENGVVTEERWRSSASTYIVSTSTTLTFSVTTNSLSFTTAAWLNRTDMNLVS